MAWADMWGVESTPENRQAISVSLHHCLSKLVRKPVICWPDTLTTPSQTGLHLLSQLGADLTPICADYQAQVRECPQHRIEWRWDDPRPVADIYCYDGRLMYLGCCDEISFPGAAGCDEGGYLNELPENDLGLALVQWLAPSDWQYPGLLPHRDEERRVSWPALGRGWCGLQEARLAMACGWKVEVLRLLHWPKPASRAWRDRPLGALMRSLAALRQAAVDEGRHDLANVYRAIGLQTIGELWSQGHREVSRPAREGETVSLANYAGTGPDGRQEVRETVQRTKRPEWSHPEVAALVWAAARRRITRALLEVPPETIIAVYGDAIYLTQPAPPYSAWQDNGSAGRLRLAWQWHGPSRRLTGWHDLAYAKSDVQDA